MAGPVLHRAVGQVVSIAALHTSMPLLPCCYQNTQLIHLMSQPPVPAATYTSAPTPTRSCMLLPLPCRGAAAEQVDGRAHELLPLAAAAAAGHLARAWLQQARGGQLQRQVQLRAHAGRRVRVRGWARCHALWTRVTVVTRGGHL
jgi:hypothetical protein